MRIAFMGTPDFAVPTLDALVAAGHELAAVYCQPPRPAGRGKALMPSPVQRRAEELGIAVRTPATLRDAEAQAGFAALDLDAAVVAAYGLILPQPILDAPRRGCLNVHGSLLPRWRGAAPVQRAILAGDPVTGVTIMRMERGLDTGPMLATVETPVAGKTAGELTDELARRGAALMVDVLADLPAYPPVVQPEEGVTYAAKIDKAEARIDFAEAAGQIERQVRAYNPAPGAWFEHLGERIRILACEVVDRHGLAAPGEVIDDRLTIECINGAIRPTRVQRAGKAAMSPEELLRGFAIPPGTHLDGPPRG
ncbi:MULTISPECIES: methionyl-tRNA formyltransferase [unclassified Sphingomonas]|uniref:methionyl-tRNA formyltransferase n=1 Tax=unclassified Sphingomonas TaxID=196159 RepID=UPI0006FC411B|nr:MULTISPECIES: methionyl-tRNA formyltransferase [unclassified Sphingomonas]KQX22716.1 methionyl-tRNA formyltransferase [Sphingomonas sp. Root1294]KQY67803.1 methionyl-tRNA formyltransferase [Sphingomonas sp. Root50]KRB88727.1 methionyl-tRNA formyltransferase [Sphingomonas sp. Root720]